MKIVILHARAGHGHLRVAEVIAKAVREKAGADAEVRVEDALDSTPFPFRRLYPAIYYYAVKYVPRIWGFFFDFFDHPAVDALLRPLRSVANRVNGVRLLRRLIRENPDRIVCTHFFSAELLATARRRGELASRLITVVTDYYPHAFWINPGTDAYWGMCAETRAALLARGVSEAKIHADGIPVDPAFKSSGNRRELLVKWGLDPERFSLLLTSGSFGLGPTEQLLNELAPFRERIQCMVVCGNNRELKTRLDGLTFPFPVRVFGFADCMPDLMEASDLVVAKPGGSTATECLTKRLPMIVLHPIPGQEMHNAQILRGRNAAFFMERPEQLAVILKTILENPEILAEKKRNIDGLARPDAAADFATFILS